MCFIFISILCMYACSSFFLLYALMVNSITPNCPPGRGGIDCQPCGVGRYKSTWGVQDCLVCAKGTVSLNTTSTSLDNCKHCPVNTYEQSWIECVKCPVNTISPVGSTSLIDCVARAGYYGLPGQAGNLCPAGTYCPMGMMRPAPCPQGSAEGADKCQGTEERIALGQWDLVMLVSWGVVGCLGVICFMGVRKTLFVIPTDVKVHLIPMKIQV